MNKHRYPWIAMLIGLILLTALLAAGAASGSGEYSLPLLTMLFMSELGMLVSGAGAFVGGQLWLARRSDSAMLFAALVSAVLAIGLLVLGLVLWSSMQAAQV
jgi:hypothetical protein